MRRLAALVASAAATAAAASDLPGAPAAAAVAGRSVPSAVGVLEAEVRDLEGKTASLQSDKQALVKTVQQVLRSNQTDMLTKQLRGITKLKASMEERCTLERAALEHRTKSAEDEVASTKEVMEAMKVHYSEMEALVAKLQAENAELRQRSAELAASKDQVMQAMHTLLRKSAAGYSSAEPCDCKHPTAAKDEARDAQAQVAAHALAGGNSTHAAAAHKRATSLSSGRRALRGDAGAASGKARKGNRRKVAKLPRMEDDPIAYMGETGAITEYVARAGASDPRAQRAAEARVASAVAAAAVGGPRPPVAAVAGVPMAAVAPPSNAAAARVPSAGAPPGGARGRLLRWLDATTSGYLQPSPPSTSFGGDSDISGGVGRLDPEADRRRTQAAATSWRELVDDANDEYVRGLLDKAESELTSASRG